MNPFPVPLIAIMTRSLAYYFLVVAASRVVVAASQDEILPLLVIGMGEGGDCSLCRLQAKGLHVKLFISLMEQTSR